MYAMASAIDAAVRPAPKIAVASTASRMPGNANRMSSPEEITASTVPRRQAAATASRAPAVMLRTTTASGPSIEDCAPASSRENTSRPWKSYPSKWPPPGATQASERFGRLGLYGAISGPKTAASVASAMTAADTMPATPVPRSPDSGRVRRVPGTVTVRPAPAVTVPPSLGPAPQRDARVQHRVHHVHEQVDHDERGDQHERDALHHREVLGLRGLDQVGAEPVQAERGLHHGRHGDQRRDRDPGDRGDRYRRVAQDVPPDQLAARDAAAHRGLHVLALALLPDRRPGDPGHDRERRERQGNSGQREVPHVAQ